MIVASSIFLKVMKEKILQRLKAIESRYDVKVLLAVESGSRAWGFASKDSDYDVRFVYVHRKEWYLQLVEGRDVIEELDPDGVMDFAGWDIKKALLLMGKGNCAFAEWLNPYRILQGRGFLYGDEHSHGRLLQTDLCSEPLLSHGHEP